jgi:hypothetical protein
MNTDSNSDPRSIMEAVPMNEIPQISKQLSSAARGPGEDINMDVTMGSSSKDEVPNFEDDLGGADRRQEAQRRSEESDEVPEACHSNSEENSDSTDALSEAKEEEIGDFKRLPGQ